MKRLLFVDDEPQILDGLRDSLHKQRRHWDMTFCTSGRDALRAMQKWPAVVGASCASRLGGDGHRQFGTLPPGGLRRHHRTSDATDGRRLTTSGAHGRAQSTRRHGKHWADVARTANGQLGLAEC